MKLKDILVEAVKYTTTDSTSEKYNDLVDKLSDKTTSKHFKSEYKPKQSEFLVGVTVHDSYRPGQVEKYYARDGKVYFVDELHGDNEDVFVYNIAPAAFLQTLQKIFA